MHAGSEENRTFLRIEHEAPLNYREVKTDKLSNKTAMFTKNVSASGLLVRTTNIPPALSSIIWIELDHKMTNICSEIEEDLLILNGGIFGRVVRIAEGEPGISYDVGICFLRKTGMTKSNIEELLQKH